MTDADDLQELEPISEFDGLDDIVEPERTEASATPTQKSPDMLELLYQRTFAGLPTPAFNPMADKEYYRFLFGGVLIVVGCLMPFSSDWSQVGYKSFAGGLNLLIGLGVIWSMWGAIYSKMFNFRWIMFAFFPFVWGILHFFQMDWSLFSSVLEREGYKTGWHGPHSISQFGNVLQQLGPGRFFVFFGALLIEVTFLMSIVRGFQRKKQQDAARSTRRR
jgi:hypothetical protein